MKIVKKEDGCFQSPTKVCSDYRRLCASELFWLKRLSYFRSIFLFFSVAWLAFFFLELDFLILKGGILVNVFLGFVWIFYFFVLYLLKKYYEMKKKFFYKKMLQVVSQHVGKFSETFDLYSEEDQQSLVLIRGFISYLYTRHTNWPVV